MLYSQLSSLLLDIYETSTCSMFPLGLLYGEFVGTITPPSNMPLIKMTISFCPAGIFYCFNVMTRVGLGSSIVLFQHVQLIQYLPKGKLTCLTFYNTCQGLCYLSRYDINANITFSQMQLLHIKSIQTLPLPSRFAFSFHQCYIPYPPYLTGAPIKSHRQFLESHVKESQNYFFFIHGPYYPHSSKRSVVQSRDAFPSFCLHPDEFTDLMSPTIGSQFSHRPRCLPAF